MWQLAHLSGTDRVHGRGILCRVWWSSEWARRTCCTSPGLSSVVCVLFAKGVEGALLLTELGWSEVYSMDDCSLCLRELLFMSYCTTSCINTGILSRVNGGPWHPLALLELLPLPWECVDISRVRRSLFFAASIGPTTTWPCGSATSQSLFWYSCVIPRRNKHTKAFYVSQHSSLGWLACQ